MDTVVRVRDGMPPHGILAEVVAADLTYSLALMEPGKAVFGISRSDATATAYPEIFRVGMMVSIERDDGLWPWAGFITQRKSDLASADVRFVCEDHAGALLARARAAKTWPLREAQAADHIHRIFREADVRAQPPLLLELDLAEGGPRISYQPQASDLLSVLDTMASAGWEWELLYEVRRVLTATLRWREHVGRDLREAVIWEQGRHFVDARYTQNAAGFIAAAVAIGGNGDIAARPAAAVDYQGGTSPDVPTRRVAPTRDGVILAPLAGTEVVIDRQVTNSAALQAVAERTLLGRGVVAEALSFRIVLGEIDTFHAARPGDIITARFSDIDMGLGLIRVVRILGMQFDPDAGMVDVECQVLRDEADPHAQA